MLAGTLADGRLLSVLLSTTEFDLARARPGCAAPAVPCMPCIPCMPAIMPCCMPGIMPGIAICMPAMAPAAACGHAAAATCRGQEFKGKVNKQKLSVHCIGLQLTLGSGLATPQKQLLSSVKSAVNQLKQVSQAQSKTCL